MADLINWIHLTDLHLGLDDPSWLWPRCKHDLFRDIEKLSREIDGWDLILFTGDFVQSGEPRQFDQLNKELEALWKILTKNGREPKLCAVPGNHDLLRPAAGAAMTKTLTQLWSSDEQLRLQFWKDPSCEYRIAINSYFENYLTWINSASVPLLPFIPGILPGDFSARFTKGSSTIGIVGLNTTFLQIASGDMKGRLDTHVSQLNSVCEGDPEGWNQELAMSILMTHQPSSWFTPEAIEHFRQEIYPPGRFFAHFCGHQHEPESFELSEAGAAPRRFRQGPSLFGLENWEGVTPKQRTHGFNVGQFVINPNDAYEKLLPRIAVKGRHGGMNLSPDHTYKLGDGDCIITPFDIQRTDEIQSIDFESETTNQSIEQDIDPKVSLLDSTPNEESARRDLAFCPRILLSAKPQHTYVRQDEQSQCEHELRKSRCVWVVADWGSCFESFLATVTERFRTDDAKPQVFHLRSEEITDIDGLESLFPQQFGMPLQAFCHLVASIEGAFLVFDGIHPELGNDEGLHDLRRIANAIVDYCPKIRLIFVSRMAPLLDLFPIVPLRALDAPDVRTYIMHHPDATPEIDDTETIEKLHERSEGLPMHLDRMLKALRVTSLASVLEAELEGLSLTTSEKTPQSLIYTVNMLGQSEDKRTKRSFRLLKVLSVLPYGETLDSLSHYLATEPFFLENALQLQELSLLDVVPLQKTNLHVKSGFSVSEHGSPKLLKVPRQVRDYVQTRLSDDERIDIVLAGLERFFGREWRDGKVKIRSLPIEYREYLASGAGNEFALVHHLISHARTQNDSRLVSKGSSLGIKYAKYLKNNDRYRDLTIVAGGLIQLLDRDELPEQWSMLASLFGCGLRMTGKNDESLIYLRNSLEIGEKFLSSAEKSSIWLNIALAEDKLKNTDAAIIAANMVKSISKADTGPYLHAETILAELTLKGVARSKKLAQIESQARVNGDATLADTIALDFANDAGSPEKQIKHLDKVLESRSRGYNQTRAIVAKSKVILRQNGALKLQGSDLQALSSSYSYLHAQRFSSLFDQCHDQLWKVFEATGDSVQLLRLFRHSSFIWRIRGDEETEAKYLTRLNEQNLNENSMGGKGIVIEVTYFFRRLKIVISEAINKPK